MHFKPLYYISLQSDYVAKQCYTKLLKEISMIGDGISLKKHIFIVVWKFTLDVITKFYI